MTSEQVSSPRPQDPHVPDQKRELRQGFSQQRRSMLPDVKERTDTAVTSHVLEALTAMTGPTPTVAAYSPLPSEPGGPAFLPRLAAACHEVWLPLSGPDGTLTWGLYRPDGMTAGALGIAEPTGKTQDSRMLAHLDAIIVPALAIDEQGFRLGKGAGYYDRALAHAGTTPLLGVVYSHEVIPAVPHEVHDLPVHAIATDAAWRKLSRNH